MSREEEKPIFNKEKRFLMLMSIILVLTMVGDIQFTTINILGNEASVGNPMSIKVLMWSAWGWFLWRSSTIYRSVYNHQNEELFNEILCNLTKKHRERVFEQLTDNKNKLSNQGLMIFGRDPLCGVGEQRHRRQKHEWYCIYTNSDVSLEDGYTPCNEKIYGVLYMHRRYYTPNIFVVLYFGFRAMVKVIRDETDFTEYYAPMIIGFTPIGVLAYEVTWWLIEKFL